MPNFIIDKNELLSHSLSDGNILTLINGNVIEKALYSDEFGNTNMWLIWEGGYGWTLRGSINESSGNQALAIPFHADFSGRAVYADGYTGGNFEISITNWTPVGNGCYCAMKFLFGADNNNRVELFKYHGTASDIIVARSIVGGVTQDSNSVITAVNTFRLRAEMTGNTFVLKYDIGLGLVTLLTTIAVIGTPRRVSVGGLALSGAGTTVAFDNDYLRIDSSNIYWATLPDTSAIITTYNEQNIGVDSTVHLGSATFTENPNMKYKVKVGTGAWSALLNSAGVQALGNILTDDGTFNIEAYHEGGTASAGWEELDCPYTVYAPTPPSEGNFTLSTLDGGTGVSTATDEVTISSPVIGDSKQVDSRVIIRKSRGGTQLGYKDVDWPISKLYSYNFKALTETKYDELKDFLKAYAGQKIMVTDHDQIEKEGWIITSSITFEVERDTCIYNVGFTFKEDTQAVDEYYVDTEGTIDIDTEASIPITREIS